MMTLEERGRLRKTVVTAGVTAICVSLAVSLAALTVMVVRTSWFAVRSVALEGVDPADEAEVRIITDAWLGRSLLAVRSRHLVYRLRELPWVGGATVRRTFPSTLKVSLITRPAVALLNSRTDYGYKMYLLDADGIIISQFGGGRPADRPVITGLELKNLYTGEKVDLPELNGLLKALGWLRIASPDLYAELEEVNFDNSYGIIRYRLFLTRRNIPVRSLRVDRDFFSALGTVLEHRGGPGQVKSMTCLSNMIFVETR